MAEIPHIYVPEYETLPYIKTLYSWTLYTLNAHTNVLYQLYNTDYYFQDYQHYTLLSSV